MDRLPEEAKKRIWRHKYTQRPDLSPPWLGSEAALSPSGIPGTPAVRALLLALGTVYIQADCWHQRHIWYYFPQVAARLPSSIILRNACKRFPCNLGDLRADFVGSRRKMRRRRKIERRRKEEEGEKEGRGRRGGRGKGNAKEDRRE